MSSQPLLMTPRSGDSWITPGAPAILKIVSPVGSPRVVTTWRHEASGARRVPLIAGLDLPRPPGTAAVSFACPQVAVSTFRFAAPPSSTCETVDEASSATATDPKTPLRTAGSCRRATRIRPPRDVIKLEDRLQYLLQPPLETLLRATSMTFPFRPFAYQLDGVAFLYPRHHAILADEMGLGKTMQAITTIRLLVRSGQMRRVLLVCPKPLVTNWVREFALWAPELPLSVVEGDRQRRHWQWRQSETVVSITNYEILRCDVDAISETGVRYDLLVLDESQRIKNRTGTTSQAARAVSRARSWALTGTPIENRAEDLVGIFEFVAPGAIHDRMKPRHMGRAAGDYILRRTKEQVLTELPPKLFRDADVELAAEQRASYDLAEKEGVVQLTDMGESLTIQHVFELILRLKQICNFDPVTGESAKLERLEADLTECVESGRKALVFSQWVQSLERLNRRLESFRPLALHGKVPPNRRDGVLERFRRSKSHNVLLMSYGVGSVGLNLQFAQYVFLFDRWWNPATEDQAINRAHRIGAAGPVTVTRFTCAGTIEERIRQILESKRELFDTILSGTWSSAKQGLSRQEIYSLFNLDAPRKEK